MRVHMEDYFVQNPELKPANLYQIPSMMRLLAIPVIECVLHLQFVELDRYIMRARIRKVRLHENGQNPT